MSLAYSISPIRGKFFIPTLMSVKLATISMEKYLGVTQGKIMEELKFNVCVNFRFSWLCDTYVSLVKHGMYPKAARIYMMHMVECPVLADKSHVYFDVKYIYLFINFGIHGWTRGCVVVTIIYHALRETTTFETRKLVGYMSPF